MEIKRLKNKVKIMLEYSTKLQGFLIISKRDLENFYLKVFLKDGREFSVDDIKEITLKLKDSKSGGGESG